MSDDAATRAAASQARAIIAQTLERGGIDGSRHPMPVTCGPYDVVSVTRPVTSNRASAKDEPYVLGRTGTGSLKPVAIDTLHRMAARHARRAARLDALTAAGIDAARPPAWTYTMHRVALAWFRHADLDPMVAASDDRHRRTMIRMLAERHGLDVDDVVVEDGRMDPRMITTRGETDGLMYVGGGRPSIFAAATLPETLTSALTGRRIACVIDHPVLRRAGPVRIEEAYPSSGGTTFILEDVQDFVRRPPPGADRRWRRMPYMAWPA